MNLGIDRLTNHASLLRLLSSLESGAIQPTADIAKDLDDALIAIAIPTEELAFPVVHLANLCQSQVLMLFAKYDDAYATFHNMVAEYARSQEEKDMVAAGWLKLTSRHLAKAMSTPQGDVRTLYCDTIGGLTRMDSLP